MKGAAPVRGRRTLPPHERKSVMKSNPKDEKCKQCYANSKKKRGTLLYCEATGVCKYVKVRGEQS